MSDNNNDFSEIPTFGDGSGVKDVSTKNQHSHIPVFSLEFIRDIFSGDYQSAPRIYNLHGMFYFFVVMVVYAIIKAMFDSLGTPISIGHILYSVIASILMMIIYLTSYILIDYFLFDNPVNIRYSMSKMGTYMSWSLIFGAVFIVYVLAMHLTGSMQNSMSSVVANFTSFAMLMVRIMDKWIRYTPLLIFVFQKGAEVKARLVSAILYLVSFIVIWILTLVGGFLMTPGTVNNNSNNGKPEYSILSQNNFKQHLLAPTIAFPTLETVMTNPKSVGINGSDSNNAQLAMAYAQREAVNSAVSYQGLISQLVNNGFNHEVAQHVVKELKLDYNQNAVMQAKAIRLQHQGENSSDVNTIIQRVMGNAKFTNAQIGFAIRATK